MNSPEIYSNPPNEELRIELLQKIKDTAEPIMTGIRLPYKGEDREFSVFRIPLKYLVYNPYNGRIGTLVKTFEVKNHKLNPENPEDIKIIEDFLWKSKEDRNKKTMDSLMKYKQQQYGIVSRNGYIIDGNRRASLLNRIYKERTLHKGHNVDHCEYFNAVILDDDADQKEILRLETTYQMGMDEKLDYNPIEKYLKTREMLDLGYSENDIAGMMGEKTANIKKNLEILEIMDQYLDYHEYNNMYSLLDKREGPFVDLNSYIKAYKEKSGNAKTNWAPSEEDISEMIQINFDYIRAKYEGKDFRNIAQISRKNIPTSFFASHQVWDSFKKSHDEILEVQEKSVDEYIKNSSGNDISEILNSRDSEWTRKVSQLMKRNMGMSKRQLEDLQEADKPLELLIKVKKTLEMIDTTNESFKDEGIIEIVKEINSMLWEWKKILEKRG